MKPHVTLDMAVTPDGRELVLSRRDDVYTIYVDSEELMCSRASFSERSLATLALEALGTRPKPRILVGGLGMGFTLRATLDALDRRSGSVVVAEVFPKIVEWNRDPLGGLAGRPCDDSRVRVVVADVADAIVREGPFDVILLDVDNGPESFTLDSNQHLYRRRGLRRLHDNLTPGGVLAVWSASDDRGFTREMARAGFQAEARRVPARPNNKGGKHVIFLGKRS